MRVIIACRTRFHAFSVAEQLQKRGILTKFLTTVKITERSLFRYVTNRRDYEEISRNNIFQLYFLIPIALILNNRINNILFDLIVSIYLLLNKKKYDVFHGWSGMCFYSCKIARRHGKIVFIERSSTHIRAQDKILNELYSTYKVKFNIPDKIISRELKEYKIADKILIPSKFVERSFIDQKVPKNKLWINNFGTNFNLKYSPQKEILTDKRKLNVVYLGAFGVRKGADVILNLWQVLKSFQNEIGLTIIGSTESIVLGIKKQLEEEGVKFIGHVPFIKLQEQLENQDVAIQLSYEEGLSMVIPQLMSLNIPVIATESSGGEDIISNNINGYVVKTGDYNEVAKKIVEIRQNPKILEGLRRHLYKKENNLTWEKYGMKYSTLLSMYEK